MALIDRTTPDLTSAALDQLEAELRRPGTDRRAGRGAFALALAGASAGAGVIHLAMVPSHAAEWMAEGLAFAAAGWAQVAFAVLACTRIPPRRMLALAGALNLVFIGAWGVSRTAGLPWGPEARIAEDVGFVDLTCVALEALAVVLCLWLLLRRGRDGAGWAAGSAVALAAVAVATAALVSPSAVDHAHHAQDLSVIVAAAHGGVVPQIGPDADLGLSQVMNGQGEGGGHTHSFPQVPVDATTQAALDAQLEQTRVLVASFPTVADAEAAGYFRSGPFAPGLGAHYTSAEFVANTDGDMDPEDLLHPTLIYDGIEPDSPLAGFMYMIQSFDTDNAPEGFAGPNDHWHYHTNVCLVSRPGGGFDAPLGADTTATQELCDQYGGFLIANTGYMVHVWTVPGYDSPQGVFSNVNARVTCADGTYYTVAPEDLGTRTSSCLDAS